MQKLKQWVKFKPRISANPALNNWPQRINVWITRALYLVTFGTSLFRGNNFFNIASVKESGGLCINLDNLYEIKLTMH